MNHSTHGHDVVVGTDGLPDDATAADPAVDDLDDRVAGALERMGHLTRTMIGRQAYAEGVSALQLQLLLRLGSAAVARTRVSDLATELDVSQATVSDALSTMRRKELVTKEQDPSDRRNAVFALTAAGRALHDRLAGWDHPLTARLGAVDEASKGVVLRVVLGLIADLHDEGVINVARTCPTCRFFDDTTHPQDPAPYHCTLLDVPFGDPQLRVDCEEHEAAAAALAP